MNLRERFYAYLIYIGFNGLNNNTNDVETENDEENIVKLDDRIVDYLPNFKLKNPEYLMKRVTVGE